MTNEENQWLIRVKENRLRETLLKVRRENDRMARPVVTRLSKPLTDRS